MYLYRRCSVHRLAAIVCTSVNLASKAIEIYQSGAAMPHRERQGHGRRGAGSLSGWVPRHDAYMYELYLQNLSRPLTGYAQDLQDTLGFIIINKIISRWFSTIGPFKGTMCVTSSFPSGRNNWSTYWVLCQYLDFIESIEDHKRLVFADEIPMKEIMIFRSVRRDVQTGTTPKHTMDANSKNRYSILAAVTIKGNSVRPVDFFVLEQCTDATLFV